jgi:hypothetical protein
MFFGCVIVVAGSLVFLDTRIIAARFICVVMVASLSRVSFRLAVFGRRGRQSAALNVFD